MIKKVFYIAIIFLSASIMKNMLSADQNKYSYDYSDPKSIVNSACLMLMNSDYSEMLNVTDLMEKKRTLQTIEAVTNVETRQLLLRESAKIISYELVGIEDFTNEITNQLMVVTVKWALKIDSKPYLEDNPKKSIDKVPDKVPDQKGESIVYTDYLLKKIDNKWKIISKKSK